MCCCSVFDYVRMSDRIICWASLLWLLSSLFLSVAKQALEKQNILIILTYFPNTSTRPILVPYSSQLGVHILKNNFVWIMGIE